jgi:hypothetical protein
VVTNRLRRPSARLPLAGGGSLPPSGVSSVFSASRLLPSEAGSSRAGHWPGRFASSSAVCALVSAFLFMGTSPVRHSAINLELRSVAELSHSSYRVKTRILLSASRPFWTRLRSTPARRLAVEGPFGTMGIELQNPVAHDLQRHAAELRRLGARRPLIDRSQGEKPPRLWPILCWRPCICGKVYGRLDRHLSPWRKAESSLVMNFTIEFFRTRPSDEAHATLDRISIVADNLNAATVKAKSLGPG